MIQYYSKDIETLGTLPEGESSHCIRVLRKRAGDEIWVTDGRGHRFKCEIIKADPVKTSVKILEREAPDVDRGYKLTLAVAPTKNTDRLEWMLEKAVEIGVDRIVLLECKRSERKRQKTERLERVMISAMNQSLALYLPLLEGLISFKDFMNETEPAGEKFFGYCSDEYPRKDFVKECKGTGNITVMIGPEGDFTPAEVTLAVSKGYMPVSFGKKRLRTETAGVYAVSAVSVLNQIYYKSDK